MTQIWILDLIFFLCSAAKLSVVCVSFRDKSGEERQQIIKDQLCAWNFWEANYGMTPTPTMNGEPLV